MKQPGTGLEIPHACPRGKNTCIALANIVSERAESFFCCGENNGTETLVAQDKYTVCFRGLHDDRISYNDKRDLAHSMAVLARALSVIEKAHEDKHDYSPWKSSK